MVDGPTKKAAYLETHVTMVGNDVKEIHLGENIRLKNEIKCLSLTRLHYMVQIKSSMVYFNPDEHARYNQVVVRGIRKENLEEFHQDGTCSAILSVKDPRKNLQFVK